MEVILNASKLKKTFKSKSLLRPTESVSALDMVNFTVAKGEVVAVIGESGSGKTTLGKAICRLMTLDEGSVRFLDEDLVGVSGKRLLELRRSFQMVFQNQSANLHPRMSVSQMLLESL